MADLSQERAWLTPFLNRIADVAGVRAALILGREKAAQEIYIPKTVGPDHWLAQLVGISEARAIASVLGPRNVVLPPSIGGAKRKRASILAEMIDKGYTVNQITAATGVARSTVYDHRKGKDHPRRKPAKDDQGTLL